MRSLTNGTLRFLTWLAVLWTIYAEQRHLLLYVGDHEIAFGSGEYVDIVATAVLLLYAVYEICHFAGATRALDAYVAAQRGLALGGGAEGRAHQGRRRPLGGGAQGSPDPGPPSPRRVREAKRAETVRQRRVKWAKARSARNP